MSYAQPYAGMKIVDLSQAIAGPYAASLSAQQGTEVIKVEPHRGDWRRWTGYLVGDPSTLSIIANLGKRSLVVDLKTGEGLEIVCQLMKAISEQGYTPCARQGLVSPQWTGREAALDCGGWDAALAAPGAERPWWDRGQRQRRRRRRTP